MSEERKPLLEPAAQTQAQENINLDHEVEYNRALIAERDRGIGEIREAVLEVQSIFKDVGTLVTEQQFGVENIAANVDLLSVNTRQADEQLRVAEDYRRRRPLVNCCMFIFALLIVGLICIVIISI